MKLSELKGLIKECIESMLDVNEGPARDYRRKNKVKIKDITKGESNTASEPGQAYQRLQAKRVRQGRPRSGPIISPEDRVFHHSPAGGSPPGRGKYVVHEPRTIHPKPKKKNKNVDDGDPILDLD